MITYDCYSCDLSLGNSFADISIIVNISENVNLSISETINADISENILASISNNRNCKQFWILDLLAFQEIVIAGSLKRMIASISGHDIW